MIPVSGRMKRRIFLAAPLLAALPLTALVTPASAASTAVPAAQPVDALDAALIALMKAGSANQGFAARYATLKPVIEKSFDLSEILQFSVGPLWSQIPAAQQQELDRLFRQYTVASYVHSFNSYDGQRFVILPGTRKTGDREVVSTDLIEKSGNKTRLAYVMANTGGVWKITDVLFDGTISKVAAQRSDFSGLVSPGNATQLIAALKKKVSTLSDGAIKG